MVRFILYSEFCEQRGGEFLIAEPINIATASVLFLVVFLIYRIIKKHIFNNIKFVLLPWFLLVHALGNISYHFMPNNFAYWVDILALGGFWLLVLAIHFSLKTGMFISLGFFSLYILKQLDSLFCDYLPFGVHFVAHIIIAVAAYLSVKKLINIYGSK